ncbi:MAG: heliorhodopsin HeR [Theionarchaea archaeon]|nr:heliorhodopsin HeR [Theionarchaea archaeon]MBU7040422.1 heliorhodopsin HeR [Theionarchaea archaeon]
MKENSRASSEKQFQNLRRFNAFMGVLHLVQGILMVVISSDFSLPVTTTYLQFNSETSSLIPVTETLYHLPLGPAVALFLFMSATAHFVVASPQGFPMYVRNLTSHMNSFRWIEYAFSASLMIVLIAMLVGIYDVGTLLALFTLTGVMNLMGYMMELHNQSTEKTSWTSYIIGCIAGVVPWIVIFISLLGASSTEGTSVPTFVIAIFISIAVFFNLFAVNMVLQYKKVGRWRDYLYGEKMYIVLSLVAKSLLAWQVFAGTLRP